MKYRSFFKKYLFIQILPTNEMGPSITRAPQHLPSLFPSTLPRPSQAHSSLMTGVWGEEQGAVEQRKIEKQRSVTFGSIDLLEPIEEDYSLESRV